MRFSVGTPPSEFVESPRWRALDEPGTAELARRGVLVGVAIGALVSGLWHAAGISFAEQVGALRGLTGLATFLVALLGLLAVHELVHVLLHPGFGATRRTVLGCSFKPFLLYACYTGTMSRDRLVAVLLAPLWVLSALPLLLFASGICASPGPLVVTLSAANAAASGVDLLGAFLLLTRVPPGTWVQNDGWRTYWTHGETPPRAADG